MCCTKQIWSHVLCFWGVLFLVLGLSEELTWSMQMQMVAVFFALVES